MAELLETTAKQLGEHFDSIQILASYRHEKTGLTASIMRGSGDWFARQGLAHSFINSDMVEDTASAIGRAINPPDESSESWKK